MWDRLRFEVRHALFGAWQAVLVPAQAVSYWLRGQLGRPTFDARSGTGGIYIPGTWRGRMMLHRMRGGRSC